jgi:hexokinase
MADAILDDISQSPVLNNGTIENDDIFCYNCELLKLKLQKVSSELSSAREIIKILQEEDNPTQRASEKPCEFQHNLEGNQASNVMYIQNNK